MNASPEPITVSVTVLKQMVLYLESLEWNIQEFLESLDIDPSILNRPDEQIPLETYLIIQEEAVRKTKDPCLVYIWVSLPKRAAGQYWAI